MPGVSPLRSPVAQSPAGSAPDYCRRGLPPHVSYIRTECKGGSRLHLYAPFDGLRMPSGDVMKLSVSIIFNVQMMICRQIGTSLYCLANRRLNNPQSFTDLRAGKSQLRNGPKTYQASCSAEESHPDSFLTVPGRAFRRIPSCLDYRGIFSDAQYHDTSHGVLLLGSVYAGLTKHERFIVYSRRTKKGIISWASRFTYPILIL